MAAKQDFAPRLAKHKDELEWLFVELYHDRNALHTLEAEMEQAWNARTAKLEKALDICCNTEKKLVVTTDKDGATSEEFTTYLLDTLKAL